MRLLQLFIQVGFQRKKNEEVKGSNSVSYTQANWRIDNADSIGLLLPLIAMVSMLLIGPYLIVRTW